MSVGSLLPVAVAVVLPVSEGADDLVAALYFKLHFHDGVLQIAVLVDELHQSLVLEIDGVTKLQADGGQQSHRQGEYASDYIYHCVSIFVLKLRLG